jgi:hypothetical protein
MTKAADLANLIGNIKAGGGTANKNFIINGNMSVSQRGTSFTTVTNDEYTLDRFNFRKSNEGEVTITQDSSGPDGFANSLKIDVTTADTSIGASQFSILEYNIEAQDLQRLAFGTSDAKNFTLSFYVKSNKTGTYAVNITQNDNSSKQVTLNYTINSADTWERKSLTFTGDTSGVINDDNGIGFLIYWWLAAGSTFTSGSPTASFVAFGNADHAAGHAVNLLDSTSNEWLITGVQLEVGQNATEFEHEPFERTLERCQRYLQVFGADSNQVAGWGMTRAANNNFVSFPLVKALRATPTVSVQGASVRFTAEGAQTDSSSIVINSVTPSVVYGNNSSNVVTLQYDGDVGPNTTINSQTIGFMVNDNVKILFASEL